MFVGGVAVQHHLQLPTGIGAGDQLEEPQELAMPMARLAGVGHPPGGDLQRREQGGRAVAEVVVSVPLDPSWRRWPDWLGAFQRLDLGLLIHTQHDRMRRRVEIQPDHIPDLGLQLLVGGELERLGLPWLEVVLGPHPGHGAVANPQFGGQQPTRPVGHAQRRNLARSSGPMGKAAADDGMLGYSPPRRPTVKSSQRRATSRLNASLESAS
jgi:hypothetical protein